MIGIYTLQGLIDTLTTFGMIVLAMAVSLGLPYLLIKLFNKTGLRGPYHP